MFLVIGTQKTAKLPFSKLWLRDVFPYLTEVTSTARRVPRLQWVTMDSLVKLVRPAEAGELRYVKRCQALPSR